MTIQAMDTFLQFQPNTIAAEKKSARRLLYKSKHMQRHLTEKNENSRRNKEHAKKKYKKKRYFYNDVKVMHLN